MKISFDGAGFCGWQIQPDVRTVQGEMESALSKLFDTRIPVTGSSRTDTGVHSLGLIVHADLPDKFEPEDLFHRLNLILPDDVAIADIKLVPNDFHARYSAVAKRYEYRVIFTKNPHLRDYAYLIDIPPDIAALNELALFLLGKHDFTAFSRAESLPENRECSIRLADWAARESGAVFVIEGNRFLHTMVRSLVGAMLDCERGRFTLEQFAEMIETGERKCNYTVAPGHGLWLIEVFYE